jgi:hypothetical protein
VGQSSSAIRIRAVREQAEVVQIKMGGLGATPPLAAAPTGPFFQDNLRKNEWNEISRKNRELAKFISVSENSGEFGRKLGGFLEILCATSVSSVSLVVSNPWSQFTIKAQRSTEAAQRKPEPPAQLSATPQEAKDSVNDRVGFG